MIEPLMLRHLSWIPIMVLALGCRGSDHRRPESDERCPPAAPKAYLWSQSEVMQKGVNRELDERLHTPGCIQLNTLAVIVCCP